MVDRIRKILLNLTYIYILAEGTSKNTSEEIYKKESKGFIIYEPDYMIAS